MIVGDKSKSVINVNSSFVTRRKNDDEIEIKNGAIIRPSGDPISFNPLFQTKGNSEENLYLNFISDPLNGSVTGCSVIKKEEFQFQDRSFHYPVVIRKNELNEGINSDIVHYRPDYGGLNIQMIDELVDDPNRFIIKISDFSTNNAGLWNSEDSRKSYYNDYVNANNGVKILGVNLEWLGSVNYGFLELELKSTEDTFDVTEQDRFIPLAMIDTDRKDFTILF